MKLRSLRWRCKNWPAMRNCVRSWAREAGTGFITTHRKLARRGLPRECDRGKQSCMTDRSSKILAFLIVMSCCAAGAYLAVFRPGYANNSEYLGGLIFLQIVIAALWSYRQRFFPALQIVFLWAATFSPFVSAATVGRWFVLAAGAFVGFVAYMKDRSHRFGAFHLLACCCVVAAFISAMVSSHPALATLKALSIFLLFLYGAAGARLAVAGREAQFLRGLLLGCEILVYINVALHFILRVSLFNNPNSLGALTGVALAPLLAWGIVTSNEITTRRRRSVAVIQEHPWFGSGFGTSKTAVDEVVETRGFASNSKFTREHGSSYLAILEWQGLLGVAPFLALVLAVALNAGEVLLWVPRTGNVFSPAFLFFLVVIAGLVHAAFEDWLFAVGYYLCVFFWSLAFVLNDFVSHRVPAQTARISPASQQWLRRMEIRSEERRVGKECRSRWSPDH